MNMNREEFLKALREEGLLVYGTTYEENFKKLKELQNYKKIVEEIDERLMPGKVNIVDCPDHTNMGDLSTLEFVRLVIKDIKEKYFPKLKHEAVLIFTIKGAKLVVEEITEHIKSIYNNSEYVDVKEGTRAENVQEN